MRDWDATDTVPHEVWLTATRLEDEGDLSGYGDSKSSRDEGDDDDDVMISTPGSDSSFGRMLRAPTSNGIDAMDVQEVDDQEPFVSPMTSQLQGLGNDFEFEF